MYVYHDYFQARKVALVYPSLNENTTSGYFYETSSNCISQKECSIIFIPVKEDIKTWQKSISDQFKDFFD